MNEEEKSLFIRHGWKPGHLVTLNDKTKWTIESIRECFKIPAIKFTIKNKNGEVKTVPLSDVWAIGEYKNATRAINQPEPTAEDLSVDFPEKIDSRFQG